MTISSITPYLFFGGRSDEAIDFYRQAVGAEVEMVMRFNESPDPVPEGAIPSGFDDKIMHASILINGIRLLISDGCGEPTTFSGFSLALNVSDEATARKTFDALSDGGSVQMPLEATFWSPCYGMLTDRFNVSWMVMVPGEENSGS